MAETTRAKIVKHAISSFNASGFSAINLHELAKGLDMSRGNLAYHFKTKDLLLKAISDQMWQKIEEERSKSKSLPSFENLHNTATIIKKIQREYAFIFSDRHVQVHPFIKKKYKEMLKESVEDNLAIFSFSMEQGNLKAETFPGQYYHLAYICSLIIFFWQPQQIIGENKADYQKMLWSLLYPQFTAKGKKRFSNFFGKDYVENLGPSFQTTIDSIISF